MREITRQAGPARAADRSSAASDPAGLHRRACAFPADAGHRVLWRGAARLARTNTRFRRSDVLQSASTDAASRGFSSTRWCATARRPSPPTAPCTRNRPRPVFAEAEQRDMLIIAGKVMMDRNAPAGLTDTPQSGYDDSKALIRWHGKGRQRYAVTPRFAITSSPEQMEMAGALVREHPDLPHADASVGESRRDRPTQELYPWSQRLHRCLRALRAARRQEPVRPLHPPFRPRGRCAVDSSSVAVFCPTSNLFLGSGLFDYQRYRRRARPLRIATATDVGGGTNYSMLRTMDEGYKVIALNGEKLNPLASFWQLTPGNAEALSIGDRVGELEPGKDADIMVLDSAATPRCGSGWRRSNRSRKSCSAADARRRPRRGRDLHRRTAGQERAAGLAHDPERGSSVKRLSRMSTSGSSGSMPEAGGPGCGRGAAMGASERHRRIAAQEAALMFPAFDEATAFSLGVGDPRARLAGQGADHHRYPHVRSAAVLRGAPWLDRRQCRMGAAQAQCRGQDSTEHLPHGARLERPDRTFRPGSGIDSADYVLAGGGFPVAVRGAGVIGVIAGVGPAGARRPWHHRRDTVRASGT